MRFGLQALFDEGGARKYVCAREQLRFLAAAKAEDAKTSAFCQLLAYTGCRISEALAVTPSRLDAGAGCVVFQTLKRRRVVYRAVPVPPALMASLQFLASQMQKETPLFNWCRQTAWSRVKRVMEAANISGAHATPKGLRHGFGVANAEQRVPMATTQKWLGHASLETTAIYQQAVGREERALASRLWRAWQS